MQWRLAPHSRPSHQMVARATAGTAANRDHLLKRTVVQDTLALRADHSLTGYRGLLDLQSLLDSVEYLPAARTLHPDYIR